MHALRTSEGYGSCGLRARGGERVAGREGQGGGVTEGVGAAESGRSARDGWVKR